ncbi:hypothetical protein EYE40_00560 [Glaciihabitans arcticus]|uniref:Uncharacterized protein n=1 Tax=Glaciihabitans arcticus TaxID=2668039 RepID=A0A4V2JEL3_9MICO|nr:hypothetical protein [Glaciihabitans arcticus]TBN56009.1 hypothetical protein EYE40_00560 [Glaciihabitans arcticus]
MSLRLLFHIRISRLVRTQLNMDSREELEDRRAKERADAEKRAADAEFQLSAEAHSKAKKARRAAALNVLKAKWGRWLRGHRLWWMIGSFFVGVVFVFGSYFSDVASPAREWRNPWLSNLLVNAGTAFVLFGLFYVLTERLSARVKLTERDVGQTQSDLQNIEDDRLAPRTDSTRRGNGLAVEAERPGPQDDDTLSHSASIDAAPSIAEVVQAGMARRRLEEEALYEKVATQPTSKLVHMALMKAKLSGVISSTGPRCELRETDLHVRFLASVDSAQVILQLETADGVILATLAWGESNDAGAVIIALGTVLIRLDLYPGDQLYFGSDLLTQLSDLLMYASRYRQSVTGERDIHGVIEVLDSGWVIMDRGMVPKTYRAYLVASSRLDESDWASHIRNKAWPESRYVEEALAIARGLHGVVLDQD